MKVLSYSVSTILLILLSLSLLTDWDRDIVVILNVLLLLNLLNNLGRTIVLREIIALYTSFSVLFMPWVGYEVYNRQNDLAALWGRFMPVSDELYFSFAVPGVIAYVLFLCFPLNNAKYNDRGENLTALINKAKKQLEGNKRYGIYLMVAGILVTTVVSLLPVSLQFFFNLVYFASYAGLLYVFFSKQFPFRNMLMIGFGTFILLMALRQGMFTIVVYMGMTLFPFFFIGKKASLLKKLTLFVTGVFLIALIQSVKPAYRLALWKNKYQGNQAELFYNLMAEKLQDPKSMFNPDEFFFIYYRTNQGYNQALVMKFMPSKKPFDNGENLFISIASSFVPRFIWPDKPEAGGKANMKYYTGYTIKGWATNVGPLGEAYGSFGMYGGIVYMMVLGFVIRFFFARILILAKKFPLIIFWFPVLFYQVTYAAENDTLQILNSLIKTSLFMYILYWLFPVVFDPNKTGRQSALPVRRSRVVVAQ
jgi:hypothetical protein